MTVQAGFSSLRAERGMLLEYSASDVPLVLPFLFNPTTITRTRSVSVKTGGSPGARGGYGFSNRSETTRASQGVSNESESYSLTILLDATDRMDAGDPTASRLGVQPEIDVIRSMLEPKSQVPGGASLMNEMGHGQERAFTRHETASVLVFKWGLQVLPVFMTQAQIVVKEYLPNLAPYRAEATLTLQVIESKNPIYDVERKRQAALARSFLNLAGVAAEAGKL